MASTNPWFRMYTEAVDDEKLRLIAFEDRWHFTALLCCKGQGILDDQGPLMRRKVAIKLGIDLTTLDEVARRLGEVGLIDPKTLQPVAWDNRQFQSDSSTARVKAYRERAKRQGNVSVTAQEEETDTEEDKESDKQQRQPEQAQTDPSIPAEPKATKRKRSPSFNAEQMELPSHIPAELWGKWVKHRREIRKPLTEETAKGQIEKLAEYLASGWTPKAVIDHCVAAGYQGLFTPNGRPVPDKSNVVPMNRQEALEASNRDVVRRALGGK